jgi:hypothetical protein
MADYLPDRFPADSVPFTVATSATVVAGNLVHLTTSGTVEPSAASNGSWVGVAAQGGVATDVITVFTEGIHDLVTTAAAVAIGAVVVPAAAGQVATIGAGVDYSAVVGLALTAAGGSGGTIKVLLR